MTTSNFFNSVELKPEDAKKILPAGKKLYEGI